MKKSELREIVKQTILENQKSSTKLGKDLSGGDILSANGKKIISIERNKPLQGKLTVKVEGSNKPLIFDEQSEYGITISLKENQPQRAPQRQSPDREVIEKPDTAPEKPTRRRTLTPPEHAPETRPKAESVIKEGDKEVANKIASRFAKLNKGSINENANRGKAISIILKNTDKYTKETLESKTDQELAKLVQGFIGNNVNEVVLKRIGEDAIRLINDIKVIIKKYKGDIVPKEKIVNIFQDILKPYGNININNINKIDIKKRNKLCQDLISFKRKITQDRINPHLFK